MYSFSANQKTAVAKRLESLKADQLQLQPDRSRIRQSWARDNFKASRHRQRDNNIEPQGPEKIRKILMYMGLDGVATPHKVILQSQTTLWSENKATLSRQYCRVSQLWNQMLSGFDSKQLLNVYITRQLQLLNNSSEPDNFTFVVIILVVCPFIPSNLKENSSN